MTVGRHLFISGRVQGVFFRESTRQEAESLGVVGWVRNLRDGRVEAFVQGEDSAVAALVSWCRSGPPMARVDHMDVREVAPDEGLMDFEVRR